MSVAARLDELGLSVPAASKPLAAYVPAVVTGDLVFVSGQLPMVDGQLPMTGKVGDAVTVEQAQQLARTCVLNGLAAVSGAIGSLDRITRVVKLVGFVASGPDFAQQPQVINGASELLGEIFGEAGRHARAAVSAPALPLDSPVEIEFVFEFA